jgi:hypothetical protein
MQDKIDTLEDVEEHRRQRPCGRGHMGIGKNAYFHKKLLQGELLMVS